MQLLLASKRMYPKNLILKIPDDGSNDDTEDSRLTLLEIELLLQKSTAYWSRSHQTFN